MGSLRSSPESIINSISCTPREPSSIGTSVRVWKKVNSLKPEKILPPSRRIMKRLVSKPPKVKVKKKVWSDQSVIITVSLYSYVSTLFLNSNKKHYSVKKKKKKKNFSVKKKKKKKKK